MKLTQNQADAFRWLADGKKVEGACFDKHHLAVKVNAANISNLLLNGYIFRLAQETTVVYHVHEKVSGCHLYERYTEEEAWDVVGEFCYIVKHTVTNGVPAVEVVK